MKHNDNTYLKYILFSETRKGEEKRSRLLTIYIVYTYIYLTVYIYKCVCVCVCVGIVRVGEDGTARARRKDS